MFTVASIVFLFSNSTFYTYTFNYVIILFLKVFEVLAVSLYEILLC